MDWKHSIGALGLILATCSPRETANQKAHMDDEAVKVVPHAPEAHAHAHGNEEAKPIAANFEGPGKLHLPEDLRGLLVAEMAQVESAMHRMLSVLARGDLATVEATAQAVHDSFILAQKLTLEQAKRLGELLPPEFVSLDGRFHRDAAALREAARARDARRAAQLYATLTSRCVQCHQAYARDRFPGLATAAAHPEEGEHFAQGAEGSHAHD